MIFYSLYYFSFLSFHFTHTFFFFPTLSPPHTLYLYHTPFFSFFSLIQVSSIPTLFSKKILQHFLFFSPIRSLWFFFFFSSTRCPYISIPLPLFALSPSCATVILQRTLSLCFFSFFIFFIFFIFF